MNRIYRNPHQTLKNAPLRSPHGKGKSPRPNLTKRASDVTDGFPLKLRGFFLDEPEAVALATFSASSLEIVPYVRRIRLRHLLKDPNADASLKAWQRNLKPIRDTLRLAASTSQTGLGKARTSAQGK